MKRGEEDYFGFFLDVGSYYSKEEVKQKCVKNGVGLFNLLIYTRLCNLLGQGNWKKARSELFSRFYHIEAFTGFFFFIFLFPR